MNREGEKGGSSAVKNEQRIADNELTNPHIFYIIDNRYQGL
jgi:hypothetical protein